MNYRVSIGFIAIVVFVDVNVDFRKANMCTISCRDSYVRVFAVAYPFMPFGISFILSVFGKNGSFPQKR